MSTGKLLCFLNMLLDSYQISLCLVLFKLRLLKANLRGGNHSYTTLLSNSSGQSAKTHSNSHASLNDRKLCNHISDSQFSQHNMYLRTCINSIFLFDIQII